MQLLFSSMIVNVKGNSPSEITIIESFTSPAIYFSYFSVVVSNRFPGRPLVLSEIII